MNKKNVLSWELVIQRYAMAFAEAPLCNKWQKEFLPIVFELRKEFGESHLAGVSLYTLILYPDDGGDRIIIDPLYGIVEQEPFETKLVEVGISFGSFAKTWVVHLTDRIENEIINAIKEAPYQDS